MALGLIVKTGRILTAKLLLGQAVDGITHCAIGDGDSSFTDPPNPPAPDIGQTGLINERARKRYYKRTFLKEDAEGALLVNGVRYLETGEETNTIGIFFCFDEAEANGITIREYGFFGGDVQYVQSVTGDLAMGGVFHQDTNPTGEVLARDDAQPLELNVVDNYQAGEIRSTKNLSGGESFIVSLSLALGLSHMASKNVRVDSLFLDEGFGTLDEEALDTALETLAGLQQDGKLIGVISHVPALKERISTQIQVTPQTGGRSQISGPGCGRLGVTELAVEVG